jgi:hypothetical protein
VSMLSFLLTGELSPATLFGRKGLSKRCACRCFSFTLLNLMLFCLSSGMFGQNSNSDDFHSTRIGISAGMGVNYHTAQDIVNRINGSGIINQRVGDFKSAVEFFGAVSVPVSRDWVVKGEYVYMLASHSLASRVYVGAAEFSYNIHMPTVIGQYILFEAPTYNLKAGAGLGYHFGMYEEKFFNVRYSSKGIGSLIELEGNNALGESLFAYLGVQARWDFVGNLQDANGKSPSNAYTTSMNFFSVGARLGMTYYF